MSNQQQQKRERNLANNLYRALKQYLNAGDKESRKEASIKAKIACYDWEQILLDGERT